MNLCECSSYWSFSWRFVYVSICICSSGQTSWWNVLSLILFFLSDWCLCIRRLWLCTVDALFSPCPVVRPVVCPVVCPVPTWTRPQSKWVHSRANLDSPAPYRYAHGGRIHYIEAPMEASNDHRRSLYLFKLRRLQFVGAGFRQAAICWVSEGLE